MAVYKVPQDVEAEDRLLGPFTFRQFVYLMIVGASIAVAYGLAQLLLPLALIPMPIIIFFGALALPLRKDQPMETYLAAVIQFLTKPRIRIWTPDGVEQTVEILAPKIAEARLTKDLSSDAAASQLGYLARVVDTGGWAAVNPSSVYASNVIKSDVAAEASSTTDVLDPYNQAAQNIDTIMKKSTISHHDQLIATFKKEALKSSYLQDNLASPINDHNTQQPQYQAEAPKAHIGTAAPGAMKVSPDIIKLANDSDLTVETIASQANRILKRSDDEVVISLR